MHDNNEDTPLYHGCSSPKQVKATLPSTFSAFPDRKPSLTLPLYKLRRTDDFLHPRWAITTATMNAIRSSSKRDKPSEPAAALPLYELKRTDGFPQEMGIITASKAPNRQDSQHSAPAPSLSLATSISLLCCSHSNRSLYQSSSSTAGVRADF